VFVPRPHTEELARRAAAVLPPAGRAADLCAGSGAVAAHLVASVDHACVVAVDTDPRAVACSRRNGLLTVRGDASAPLRPRSFDVVTAVAPYVPRGALHLLPADVQRHEPVHALDGGADGLVVVAEVITAAAELLRAGGHLLLELGGDQERRVSRLLAAARFATISPWYDEDGDLRGVHATTAT
jgi:release factor glutamine methyltransferase